jgi:hypothetical protein
MRCLSRSIFSFLLFFFATSQSIWDKSEVLWRTCLGTHWELGERIKNLMGTHWELEGNIVWTHWEPGKNEKKSFPPPPFKLKRKNSKAPWVHAWAFPLAAWNLSSQKSSSPVLAWANTSCKEHPTYYHPYA